MKMGDGGFRPAYNLQLASDVDSLVIVSVEVPTAGSDQGQMVPMIEQVRERCGQAPEAWLVDGGFGVTSKSNKPAHTPRCRPVPAAKGQDGGSAPARPMTVLRWRRGERAWGPTRPRRSIRTAPQPPSASMPKAATGDCSSSSVRGLAKVKCVVPFFALAHNLMRMASLAPEMLAPGKGASAVSGIGAF